MNAINKLITTLGAPASFPAINGGTSPMTQNLKDLNMTVNGETDSQPSSPPFPAVADPNNSGQNLPEGNPSLGQARANNLLQLLQGAHPANNKTNVINHSGTVKSKDRNSSIFFGT